MRRTIPLILGLLLSALAWAATLEATATNPTVNTDGSPIPVTGPGALSSIRFEYGTCVGAAFGTVLGSKIVTLPVNKAVFSGIAPGLICVRAYWTNNLGGQSAASAVSVAGPPPNPGSIILVTVSSP